MSKRIKGFHQPRIFGGEVGGCGEMRQKIGVIFHHMQADLFGRVFEYNYAFFVRSTRKHFDQFNNRACHFQGKQIMRDWRGRWGLKRDDYAMEGAGFVIEVRLGSAG